MGFMKKIVLRIPAPVWIVAGAIAFWLVYRMPYLTYDTFYALIWGGDIAHGRLPDYSISVAPTPHPLATLVSVPASLAGNYADDILIAISYLSFSALCWAVFRLGSLTFSWPVGLLAAVIIATRQPLESLAIRAYVDVPFLALVIYAAVLELRRPKRGAAVLVLLGLAGLLRPEAWAFAAAYYIYLAWGMGWRQRAVYAALTLAAPLLWMAYDLVIAGDALYSLHGTSDLAATLNRRRTLVDIPIALPEGLGYQLREPVLIGAVAGAVFSWIYARGRAAVLAALFSINVVTFIALALVHLPLLARYLLVAAVVLAVLCSAAALGWLELPTGPGRNLWTAVGVVTCLLLIFFIPFQYGRLATLRQETVGRGQMQEDVRRLADSAQASAFFVRCKPVYTPNYRTVPLLRYWLNAPASEVVSALDHSVDGGLMIGPTTDAVRRTFVLDPLNRNAQSAPVPRSFKPVYENHSWVLYASPQCRGAL